MSDVVRQVLYIYGLMAIPGVLLLLAAVCYNQYQEYQYKKKDKAKKELISACSNNNVNEFDILLQKHKKLININTLVDGRDTLLHLACRKNHLDIVLCILKQKDVNVNAKNIYLRTPLHLAPTIPIIELLLNRKDINSDDRDCYGCTRLDNLSHEGDLHKLTYFLARRGPIEKTALKRMPSDTKKLWSAWTAFLSLENAEKESAFLLVSLPARKTNFLECDLSKIINLFVYFSHWQKNICPNMRVMMNLYGAYLQYKNHATIEQSRRFMDIMEKAVKDEQDRSEVLYEIKRLHSLDTFKSHCDLNIAYKN